MAAERRAVRGGERPAPARAAKRPAAGRPERLDEVIHQKARLGILSALAAGGALAFADLKQLLGLSDGNLSVHARKLEEAGYVTCSKGFTGRTPVTTYELNAKGRKALGRYLDHMEALISATRRLERARR